MYIKSGSSRGKDWLEFVIEDGDWQNSLIHDFFREIRSEIPAYTGGFYDKSSKIYAIHRDFWDKFYELKTKYFPKDE